MSGAFLLYMYLMHARKIKVFISDTLLGPQSNYLQENHEQDGKLMEIVRVVLVYNLYFLHLYSISNVSLNVNVCNPILACALYKILICQF